MKIAVLCGGLSPERNVSISSGTKIAGALKENGHQVVLLDMFFGLEDYTGDIARVFDDPPALGGTRIDESAPGSGGRARTAQAPEPEPLRRARARGVRHGGHRVSRAARPHR